MRYIAAAVLLLAVVVSFRFQGALAAPAVTGPIHVTATLAQSAYRSEGSPGRQSDGIDQSWRITDRNGRRVGRMIQQCRWITRLSRLCYGELEMPLGKITFAGSSPTAFQGEFAVTGGTGTYRAGGGVMLFRAIGLRKTVLFITIEK